jgi:hypothetical protein
MRLLFLEHLRSDDPARRRLRLQPADPLGDRRGRLHDSRIEHVKLPEVPKFVRPAIVGVALAPS